MEKVYNWFKGNWKWLVPTVIVILGLATYFATRKRSGGMYQKPNSDGSCDEGLIVENGICVLPPVQYNLGEIGQSPKTDGTCNPGLVLVGGKCTANTPTGGVGQAPNKSDGKCDPGLIIKDGKCAVPLKLKAGDPAYISPSYQNKVNIFSQPTADNEGTYIVGEYHRDWGQKIGTVIEYAGDLGFVKILVDDLQVYTASSDFDTLGKLDGEYYVDANAIFNTAYGKNV